MNWNVLILIFFQKNSKRFNFHVENLRKAFFYTNNFYFYIFFSKLVIFIDELIRTFS